MINAASDRHKVRHRTLDSIGWDDLIDSKLFQTIPILSQITAHGFARDAVSFNIVIIMMMLMISLVVRKFIHRKITRDDIRS